MHNPFRGKIKYFFALSLVVLISFSAFFLFRHTGLKINLIASRNGVGLDQDIDLLSEELKYLGHQVTFIDVKETQTKHSADINIFLQDLVEETFLSWAKENVIIPNPEWCCMTKETMAKFDKILCKTKETERIFKQFHPNAIYMGFSCRDRYDQNVIKDFKRPLHIAGASIQKGTDAVVKVWLHNPQYPPLLLAKHLKSSFSFPLSSNIKLVSDYLPEQAIVFLQNKHGLHVCPSETEGFGHYIMEAMSAGAVVVTTDAPPMNEFIADKRCLVKYKSTGPWRLATGYYVDQEQLDRTISLLLSLSEKELQIIGQRNRAFYLENAKQFKKKLRELFPPKS